MKVRKATRWSDLAVGQTIVYRGDDRRFVYQVEGLVWRYRYAEVSIQRPGRKRRENVRLYNVPQFIKEGRIWIRKEEVKDAPKSGTAGRSKRLEASRKRRIRRPQAKRMGRD